MSRFTGATAISSADYYDNGEGGPRRPQGAGVGGNIGDLSANELMNRLSIQVASSDTFDLTWHAVFTDALSKSQPVHRTVPWTLPRSLHVLTRLLGAALGQSGCTGSPLARARACREHFLAACTVTLSWYSDACCCRCRRGKTSRR